MDTQERKAEPLRDFLDDPAAFEALPLFYRKLERYTDDMASKIDVENLNMMPVALYQTTKASVGFFYKRAAHINWNEEQLIFKQL